MIIWTSYLKIGTLIEKIMARFLKINLDITHRCTLQCQRCNRAIFARVKKCPVKI